MSRRRRRLLQEGRRAARGPAASPRGSRGHGEPPLTEAQAAVMLTVGKLGGATPAEVAAELGMAPRTAAWHLTRLTVRRLLELDETSTWGKVYRPL